MDCHLGYAGRFETGGCMPIDNYNGGNPLALLQGTILSKRYKVDKVLGAGGFGITYLAEDRFNHMVCAIKEYVPVGICARETGNKEVYPLSVAKKQDFQHGKVRFIEEAQVLSELQHIPNVVHITDYFSENNTAYYVMEFLDGMTVKQLMKCMPENRIPIEDAIEIVQKVGESLDRIHKERHLLHRDISPDNLFYTKSGEIKLIDFGSAKHLSQEEKNIFSIVLKPGFAPPEQYAMDKAQGNYTDEYALAGTFYYMVTGKMPVDAMERMTGIELIPADELCSDVSKQMWRVLMRAMSLDAKTRYSSVGLFIHELVHAFKERNEETISKYVSTIKEQVTISTSEIIYLRPVVQVVSGTETGKKWYLPEDTEIKIGRGTGSQIILKNCPNISKTHCILLYDSKTQFFYIQDISTNGTRVQKNQLNKSTPYRIPQGTVVVLAESVGLQVGVENAK